jgi:hypothetical protein
MFRSGIKNELHRQDAIDAGIQNNEIVNISEWNSDFLPALEQFRLVEVN